MEHIRPLSPAIASLDILPVWGHVKRGKWVPSHQHLNVSYLLVADESDALQIREGENSRVGWLPAERISGLRGRALLKILGQCDTVRMPSVPAHFCLLQAKDNNN